MGGDPKRQPIRSFRDLEVYRRSQDLLRPMHALVERFPDYEKFDLADQIRRACKSVPANIAEGYARRDSVKEFKRFLRIAMASANEIEAHLETARELAYVSVAEAKKYIEEYQIIGKQLNRLIQAWRSFADPASGI